MNKFYRLVIVLGMISFIPFFVISVFLGMAGGSIESGIVPYLSLVYLTGFIAGIFCLFKSTKRSLFIFSLGILTEISFIISLASRQIVRPTVAFFLSLPGILFIVSVFGLLALLVYLWNKEGISIKTCIIILTTLIVIAGLILFFSTAGLRLSNRAQYSNDPKELEDIFNQITATNQATDYNQLDGYFVLWKLALNENTPPAVLEKLINSGDLMILGYIQSNPSLSNELRARAVHNEELINQMIQERQKAYYTKNYKNN